ncbi:hypothetical protein SLS54_008082 [Diplodia seriata]
MQLQAPKQPNTEPKTQVELEPNSLTTDPELPLTPAKAHSGTGGAEVHGLAKALTGEEQTTRVPILVEKALEASYQERNATPDAAEVVEDVNPNCSLDERLADTLQRLRSGNWMNAHFTNEVVRMVATADPSCYVIDPDRICPDEGEQTRQSTAPSRSDG